jgi:enamine deaminase RidA (YjgF/YER057c/UK114 family)
LSGKFPERADYAAAVPERKTRPKRQHHPAPAGAYVSWARTGDLLFLSGHMARRSGALWIVINPRTTEAEIDALVNLVSLTGTELA